MAKLLYGVAAFCFMFGMLDVVTMPVGSRGATEGGILLILTVMFGIAGFIVGRTSSKLCMKCQSRIPKSAAKCRYCSSDQN